jgi:hypothetical protein
VSVRLTRLRRRGVYEKQDIQPHKHPKPIKKPKPEKQPPSSGRVFSTR